MEVKLDFNGPLVNYDPKTMWFDYQALFYETRSVYFNTVYWGGTEHTDFDKNKLARHAICLSDDYEDTVDMMLMGNFDSICKARECVLDYAKCNRACGEWDDITPAEEKILDYNSDCLLGVLAPFCEYGKSQYLDIVYDDLPKNFDDASKVKFYDIMLKLK